jgi:glutathione S-transferase
MLAYRSVAIITLLSGVLCFGMSIAVARARRKTGIAPPAISGDPYLERCLRAHANTLEWMPVFLPALWLFAIYASTLWATVLGAVWILARIVYFAGYAAEPRKRFMGFGIQALTTLVLLFGALGRIAWSMVVS